MSLLDEHNTTYLTPRITDATVKRIVSAVVWNLFDSIKDEKMTLQHKVWKIPVNLNIPISFFEPIIERLVGSRVNG